MKIVAIIPLRKESKGIINKNKRKLLGRPLYQWVLTEAIFSKLTEIYVFTDDDEIIQLITEEYKWAPKVKTFLRSAESATDEALTECGMHELATQINFSFDVYCLLQATSPLTTAEDINCVINKIIRDGNDSALSVVKEKRFYWDSSGVPLNYSFLNRPRRQDFMGSMTENGAVYCIRKQSYIETKNRLGGKIGVYEMRADTLYEIDEITDFAVVESLLENRLRSRKRHPGKIRAMVFDVDGVFTDGKVGVSSDIELFKTFSLRDGMGIDLLRQQEVTPVVLTSEDSDIVRTRMKKLEIEHVFLNVKDKYSFLDNYLIHANLHRNQIAYIGDDINDLANMVSVGWSFCPNDAIDTLKPYSDIVLHNNGGDKAIREAVEFIIKYNLKF